MSKKISAELEIKEENSELQKAIAKELINEEDKDLEGLLNERETDQDNT